LVDRKIGKEVKRVKMPRKLNEFVKDIKARFLGFPHRVGTGTNALFDHDRESGDIHWMRRPSELIAWMARKSDQTIHFKAGPGFFTKEELFSALLADAFIYQSTSDVPHWPKRLDVYYKHGALPEPTKDRKYFNGFVDLFSVATPADRTLVKALICDLMWYRNGMASPLWLTDSVNGRGSGKSAIFELITELYLSKCSDMNQNDLKFKSDEIVKRIISAGGRERKTLFMDNAVGTISSSTLAGWITASHISGRAPYGVGEESRPNDLTFAISSNSAVLDDDLAVRSFQLSMMKPDNYDPKWLEDVQAYTEKYRWHILAEIYDMLDNAKKLDCKIRTRFSNFERDVLHAVCDDEAECEAALDAIEHNREASNADREIGELLEEVIKGRLNTVAGVDPDADNIFVTIPIFNKWVKWMNESGDFEDNVTPQSVRNLAKNDHTKFLIALPEKVTVSPGIQSRGYFWKVSNTEDIKIVLPGTDGTPFVIESKVEKKTPKTAKDK
jgi:hypothetical protein